MTKLGMELKERLKNCGGDCCRIVGFYLGVIFGGDE